MQSAQQKCSFISLIGSPNAGKSTLLNQLVGSKVSIVSPKVQTTRTVINGIVMEGDAQLVFLDTPGLFKPHNKLEKTIVKAAWEGAGEGDKIALLIDAKKGVDASVQLIIEALRQKQLSVILLLNKIDLVKREVLLKLTGEIAAQLTCEKVFMISALTGDGVEDVKQYLASEAKPGVWMYPEDQLTDAPSRFLAAEITREELFMALDEELPYSVSVETEKWEGLDNGDVKIHQVIYVLKESQKMIIVGKGGQQIKRVGQRARKQLEEILGHKVHLFLFVKVKENWIDRPELYTGFRHDTIL